MTETLDASERELPPLPTSLTDHAYHYLRQAILSGSLPVGAALRQEKISADLGISRLPVREALRRLDTEGLVVLRPRRGYFVALLDTSEIEELFDIRAALETRAGYLAAVHRTQADIEELSEILDSLERTASTQPLDVSTFFKTNRLFHQRFFASSKRRHLCRLLSSVQDSVDPYIRMSANISSVEASQQDHRDLFDALKAGDGELVAQLCRKHCDNSCARLIGLMRKVEQS